VHIRYFRSFLISALIVGLVCMLGFYSLSWAAPPGGQPPFEDATAQRSEMLRELREIKDLIKEQNGLLKEVLSKEAPARPNGRDKAKR
jgi:hypothetical protein